jgi:cytochrome b6-f complex iron-sulfur subunit
MGSAYEPLKPTRRGLLDWIIGAGSAVLGFLLVAPCLAYLWPVTSSGPVKARVEAGKVKDWPIWQSRKVPVGGKPVIVIRTDTEFIAFSAVCPHLGCLVEFQGDQKRIFCPCHAAAFDLKGQVTAGPPPQPLAQYQVSIVQDSVFVSA